MKKPFLYIQLLFWVISSSPELVVVQIKTQGFLKHSFICTARPAALTQDYHVISLTEFSSSTNPKWPVIVAFDAFSEWNLCFQIPPRSVDRA